MNDLPDAIDHLAKRVEALERRVNGLESRVDTLEHPLASRSPLPKPDSEAAAVAAAPAIAPITQSGSMFPVLGKSLLGIAGAYLLRAIEETSTLPRPAVASAGILYAFLWLVWAARKRGGPRFAGTIYACTSVLILAPMLWELTLRFGVLAPQIAAGVVCAYALAAIGLAWRQDLASLLRVAWIAAAALALSLAIASHAMLPFIVVLLILTAASEFVPALNRMVDLRAIVALATDAAIWILVFIYFNPQNAIGDYPPLGRAVLLAPGMAMFLLFSVSVTLQTVLRRQAITIFAAVQTTIAFLLAAVCLADFGPANSAAILGIACLIMSATIYASVFTVVQRAPGRRNTVIFSAWAAGLFLAGSFLCLPPLVSIIALGAGAIAAAMVGRKNSWLAFEFYGTLFMLAAAAASGLLRFLVSALIGNPLGIPALGVWLTVVSAGLCYAVAKPREGEPWAAQVLHLLLAALLACGLVALLIQGLFALVALKAIPGAHHVAFIRTLTLCAAALALVFGGARWRRAELTRLGYAALALVAAKLVFEDLRHGHLAYIAASIFLVALTLIAAPRVARVKQRA